MKMTALIKRLAVMRRSRTREFSVVFPATVTPQLQPSQIPDDVERPSYYISGEPTPSPNHIDIKSSEGIEKLRQSCQLARFVLNQCKQFVKPGITTNQIDELVTDLCFSAGAYPSPLNYRNFPKSVCTSVNNCVCHGIPDKRPLESGDIINVDVTVFKNGFHGDCSETFLVGNVDEEGKELVSVARDSLYAGIRACAPGKPFSGIGYAIEDFLRKTRFVVVPAFTGHGIGTYFHGAPDIFHCRNNYPGVMKPGMTFTIEPAISEGTSKIYLLEDDWTAVTRDGSRSAQFEHTVLITDDGVEILTQ